MKNFIIGYGNFLLNLVVLIEFIIALVFSINLMSEQNFFTGMLALVGFIILIVILNYFLFLIVDMHSCQEKILKNLEIIVQDFNNKN